MELRGHCVCTVRKREESRKQTNQPTNLRAHRIQKLSKKFWGGASLAQEMPPDWIVSLKVRAHWESPECN